MSIHPTHDDAVIRALSEGVGGPIGTHAGRHRWWTPLRVVLVLTAVAFALGMLQKAPCVADRWVDTEGRYVHMCYSDLPYLYTGRGFVELNWPYSDDAQVRERFEVMEYPVGISYFVWGSAWATHWLSGSPDLTDRYARDPGELFVDPVVAEEIGVFYLVNAVAFAALTLLAAGLLTRVNPGRPWDSAAFGVAPVLVLTGLINWDLLAVALVAAALWAWANGRPVLTGLLIGAGTAAKLYPLFLLGGLLVICWRSGRWREFAQATGAAALAWVLVNAPAFVTGPSQWRHFWSFNNDRGADLGSLWLVLSQGFGLNTSAEWINRLSLAFFIAWCTAVLVLGLWVERTPRFAQLGFLIVAGFLLVNKVYSPQYVLWLLPLAVIARPRWRDLIIWQAGEVIYFASVWWYLGGFLERPGDGLSPMYWLATLIRIAAELYLVAIVVRDVVWADKDPVERDELGDQDVIEDGRGEPDLHAELVPDGGDLVAGEQ